MQFRLLIVFLYFQIEVIRGIQFLTVYLGKASSLEILMTVPGRCFLKPKLSKAFVLDIHSLVILNKCSDYVVFSTSYPV